MYSKLSKLNRFASVALSLLLLATLVYDPLFTAMQFDKAEMLVAYAAVLAGTVLMDRKLARLSMNEALRSYMGKPGQS